MATSKIELLYNLRQNNQEGSKSYGLWYPRAVRRSTLNLRGLSNHIADHGSIYTPDVVSGVLSKFTSCLVELVTQGIGVKISGLGTFYGTLEAKGVETPVNYDIDTNLKGVHIRFTPEGESDINITSRALKEKVALKQNMLFDMNGVPKKIKDGELVDYGTDDDEEDGNEG